MENKLIKRHDANQSDEELKHYGVLGMKWGVRKDRQLTSGGRIKAGSKITRLTTTDEKNEGEAWVTLNDKNRTSNFRADRSSLSDYIRKKNPGAEIYNMEMKTKVDLILPDMKTKGEVIVQKLLKDPATAKRVIQSVNKELTSVNIPEETKKAAIADFQRSIKAAVKKTQIEIDEKRSGMGTLKDYDVQGAYEAFQRSLNDPKIRGMYVRELKKRGYNAVSDDNMDIQQKQMWTRNREVLLKRVQAKGAKMGFAAGFAGGLVGGQNPYVTGIGGSVAGSAAWTAFWNMRNPKDPDSVGTSSLIIFDRGDSLEVVRKRPYKGIRKAYDDRS